MGSPLFVIVEVPLLPCATEIEAGAAERLKLPTEIGTVMEELPLLFVPVIVILYVPAASVDCARMVTLHVPPLGVLPPFQQGGGLTMRPEGALL